MNRIILIGNGYDLAKGLKSGYKHFIDWMWSDIINNFNNRKGIAYEDEFVVIEAFFNFKGNEEVNNYETFKEKLTESGVTIKYKNDFFKIITRASFSNWVDIEEAYFNELKLILEGMSSNTIETLNAEFDQVKNALKRYLIGQQKEFEYIDFNFKNIAESFNLLDFTSAGVQVLKNEFFANNESENLMEEFLDKIEQLKHSDYSYSSTNICPHTVLFLNFNYTNTISKLVNKILNKRWSFSAMRYSEIEHIYIHGDLKDKEDQMVFGYGDENDEIHQEIEKRGGQYLNNIKTINYLKAPNYKKLLTFIDSAEFQVYIFGHSCGLSDKTLLKAIFENENCMSIKPFYYIDKDSKNNYEDIVKNIYRTFTNKALMRDKVVNLKYCSPLQV